METPKLYRLKKYPKGVEIVNIDHIMRISKGQSYITIRQTDGSKVNIDYTMESILDALPIR